MTKNLIKPFLIAARSDDLNFLGGNNAQQNLENDNQPPPPQIPLPPIPDMFPVQIMQQMHINESYQLPAHPCPYHQQESNNVSNHYSSDGRGSNNSSGPVSGSSSIYNNQKHLFNPFKRNSSPTGYSSNYCSLRTSGSNNCCVKGDSYCSSCSFSNNPNLTSHLTSIISKNLSSETGWQSELSSVRERNAVLFNSEYMSDITFLVGSEDDDSEASKERSSTNPQLSRIFAHKYILGSASAVFYSMLYGALAEKSSEIRLVDVEPQAFLTLLRYFSKIFHL